MLNAQRIFFDSDRMLPEDQRPEHTEKRERFLPFGKMQSWFGRRDTSGIHGAATTIRTNSKKESAVAGYYGLSQ
jgi:hypothetical protein